VPAPPFQVLLAQLLTDGRVLCVENATAPGATAASRICILTPDATGSYASGTWTTGSSMINPRQYFASHTLSDGRLYVSGGEYPSFGDLAETYDPLGNAWTSQGEVGCREGDSPSCILPDGQVVIGDINNTKSVIFDPASNAFNDFDPCIAPPDEAAWILLQNDLVLSAGFTNPNQLATGLFDHGPNAWSHAGNLPANLTNVNGETGALCGLYDGRCFFVGGTGLNAIYDPGANAWTSAAMSPLDGGGVPLCGNDSPAAVLPSGKVLVALGPQPPGGGGYPGGLSLFIYDPGTNAFTPETLPAPSWAGLPTFPLSMLMLPSGQVLFLGRGNGLALYNPDGGPQDDWRPTVTGATATSATTFKLTGTQLCGLTQGAYYGDDVVTATNFPIVYAVDAQGAIHFCRTTDISTRSIKPGAQGTCTVTLPPSLPANAQVTFHVVANGVNSSGSGFGIGGIGLAPDGTQVRCNYVAWGW
jgi:hypothetical protein